MRMRQVGWVTADLKFMRYNFTPQPPLPRGAFPVPPLIRGARGVKTTVPHKLEICCKRSETGATTSGLPLHSQKSSLLGFLSSTQQSTRFHASHFYLE